MKYPLAILMVVLHYAAVWVIVIGFALAIYLIGRI